MNLTPREKDKLLISMAAIVARKRLERGVRLNHPEAIALIMREALEKPAGERAAWLAEACAGDEVCGAYRGEADGRWGEGGATTARQQGFTSPKAKARSTSSTEAAAESTRYRPASPRGH